jgi:hypothetical protein
MAKGVYVSPNGFQFNASDDLIGDDVTFVSKYGKMAFNGGTSQFRPYFGGLLVVTEGNYDAGQCDSNWTVSITGNVNWGGIIFAPNGRVSMSASTGSTFYGSIVAGSVDLSGSNLMVIFDPSFLPPDPDTIELGE